MTTSALGAADVRKVMACYESALIRQKEVVNRLNVYPVPDGDTGTNMYLTLESVTKELAGLAAPDMAATCKAISHGSLMGARGNSGVILCQILRGLTSAFASHVEVGADHLVAGLAEANVAARAAVMRPVEGTILSVMKAAAEAAAAVTAAAVTAAAGPGAAPERGPALVEVAEAAREAAVEALWETPNQLPVLASAGVVDAGGAGLLLLFEALLHVLDGRDVPESLPLPSGVAERIAGGSPAVADIDLHAAAESAVGQSEDVSDLRYEVMYFLEAPDDRIGAFKNVWAGIGDSIVVVGGEGMWNCHIHTNDIGAAVEAALDAGRPRKIRVTDLLEQVEEESWVRQAAETSGGSNGEADLGPPPTTSVVAVATGVGIGRIFHSLGARHIVAGGQSMNPSTEQILSVMDMTPGAEVVVLPNNKNIYAVAAQACELSAKPARVVNTPGIQEGFAALLEYDPEAGSEANSAQMVAAAERVVAGEVTQAVRASSTEAAQIAEGDWIGLSRTGIEVVATTVAEATISLFAKLLTSSHEIVTIIEGQGAKPAETRRITEWLSREHPAVSVDLHYGGQPLYPYLISAE